MLEGYLKFIADLSNCSEEHKNFISSGYKCSNCQKALFKFLGNYEFNMYSKDGSKLNRLNSGFIEVATIECRNCNHRWNVKQKAIKPNKLEFVSIRETHKTEEPLGNEKRLVDNSKSSSKVTRQFMFSKEWSKSYSIDQENIQVNGLELNVGIKLPEVELANIKVTSEETLSKKYSISEETRKTSTEQFQIDIPEYKKVCITVSWKRILQHGIIKFRDQNNRLLDIPFQVAVGITFDQHQEDEI